MQTLMRELGLILSSGSTDPEMGHSIIFGPRTADRVLFNQF